MAEQAVNALHALAQGNEQEEGRKRIAPVPLVRDARKAMHDVLGLISAADQALFLREAFGVTLERLEAAQARAIQQFSQLSYARGWAQSLIQVRGGKQPLM
jgi:transcriptional regulator of acetoin/glycerol metabolism